MSSEKIPPPTIGKEEQKQGPDEVFSVQDQILAEEIQKEFIRRGDLPESARKKDVTVGTFRAPQYAKRGMQEEMEEIEKQVETKKQAQLKELRERLAALNYELGHVKYPRTHDEIEKEALAVEGELRALESEARDAVGEVPFAEERLPVITERTRKELHDALANLIEEETRREEIERMERGKVLGMHQENRLRELDAEAEKLGIVEKGFRKLGERYNKYGWKTKLAVGLSLGIGAGVALSAGSLVVATALLGAAGVQRSASLASMFLKYEKSTSDKKLLGLGKKEKAMGKAMLYTAAMTGGMLLLAESVKEGVEYANQHQLGERVQEWLGRMMGHAPPHMPEVQNPTAAGAAGETAVHHVEMPTVAVSTGHGYEQMLYKMGQELHDKYPHGLPKNFSPDSDAVRLWEAAQQNSENGTHEHLQHLVHRIADEHGFFHSDGTSTLIRPDAHLTIGADGQTYFADATHPDMIHAAEHMGSTHTYHPEATVSSPPTPTIETAVAPAPHMAPPPSPTTIEPAAVSTFDASVVHDSAGYPVLDGSGHPVHEGVYQQTPGYVSTQPSAPEHHLVEALHVTSGHEIFTNIHNVPVNLHNTHGYLDGGKIYVLGGNKIDTLAQDYALKHHVSVFVDKSYKLMGLIKVPRVIEYAPTDRGLVLVIHHGPSLVPNLEDFTKRVF